jgi:predicted house-cleaning noncanonical NTP pyrophosphatase (MazG superfamily)
VKKIFYKKLIRDKVPAKMDARGVSYEVRTLKQQEFKRELLKKAEEEASGVAASVKRVDIIAELADLIDVTDEIRRVFGISDDELQKAQKLNAEKKGGFEKKIFLEWSGDTGYKTNEKKSSRR